MHVCCHTDRSTKTQQETPEQAQRCIAENDTNTPTPTHKLNHTLAHPHTDRSTETQQETPEQAQRRIAAEDEAKRAAIRAMGTMVTPENFKQWKAKFDAEQAAVSVLFLMCEW